MPKIIVGANHLDVPDAGARGIWTAKSTDHKEDFLIDMNRGRVILQKVTLQKRYQSTEILLRLDIEGPPHTNPDGQVIPPPHLHIYQEGYADKWAHPVPPDLDISSGNMTDILGNFLKYCCVNPIPPIQGGVLP